jgi:hypothetical protein
MPVRVRKLNVMKLQELLEKEANPSKGEVPQKPTVHHPGIAPKGTMPGYIPKVTRPNTTPKRK